MKKLNITLLVLFAVSTGHAQEEKQSILDRLEATTQQFMDSLRGYRQCVMKGACTQTQSSNLRRLGGAIAALAVALVTGALLRGSRKRAGEEATALPVSTQQTADAKKLAIYVLQGEFKLAEQLLQKGISLDKVLFNDMSILENVVLTQNYPAVAWLLEHGATPYVREDILAGSSEAIKRLIEGALTPRIPKRRS